MEHTFLIAGNSSKLSVDLAHEALSQKNKVLLTVEPKTDLPPIPAGLESGLQYVEWNRRSPISARFVILQALNKQMAIDHAVLVFSPGNEKSGVHELSSAVVEEKLDFDTKGYIFLLKELVAYFLKKRSGSVTFLIQNTGPDILPPMEALLMGGFYSLAESLFAHYANEPIVFRGVETKLAANRQVAEFVFQSILEDQARSRGKWIRYNGKTGLFSFGR